MMLMLRRVERMENWGFRSMNGCKGGGNGGNGGNGFR